MSCRPFVGFDLSEAREIELVRAGVDASSLTLSGNALPNILVGNEINNTLSGDAGVDILGGGNDLLYGVAGNDVSRFLADFGNDVVSSFDFHPSGGQDLLDVSGLGVTAANFATNVTIDGATNALITVTDPTSSGARSGWMESIRRQST